MIKLKEILEGIFKENKYTVPSNKKSITIDKIIEGLSKNLIGQELADFLGYATTGKTSEFLSKVFNKPCDKKVSERWITYLLAKKELKICTKCTEVLPFSSFSLRTNNNNGLNTRCTKCVQEDQSSDMYKLGIKQLRSKFSEDKKSYLKEYYKHYRVINREQILLGYKQYNAEHKEDRKIYDHNRYLENKAYFRAKGAKYRASKLKATPNWADHIIIKQIYETCPEGYHVDHIVPLQNDLVCGLHCEFNLQHLPASENISKSNKWTA